MHSPSFLIRQWLLTYSSTDWLHGSKRVLFYRFGSFGIALLLLVTSAANLGIWLALCGVSGCYVDTVSEGMEVDVGGEVGSVDWGHVREGLVRMLGGFRWWEYASGRCWTNW
jgi:hypothetical protein